MAEDAVTRAMRRVQEAFDAFQQAPSVADAHDRWEDFLGSWQAAVNKIEERGKHTNGDKWLAQKVWADPEMKYLRFARNTSEHGLAPIAREIAAGTSHPRFMIDVGNGFGVSPSGHVGMMLGEGIGAEFTPGMLELVPVPDRHGRLWPPPRNVGGAARAVDLAAKAMAFIRTAGVSTGWVP